MNTEDAAADEARRDYEADGRVDEALELAAQTVEAMRDEQWGADQVTVNSTVTKAARRIRALKDNSSP